MCCGCDASNIVSVHIQCQASMYTFLLCSGHSWQVRLAKQETLTPPGHLDSPLICRGPWMSTVVLYCWCHSDSDSVLLYFTLGCIRQFLTKTWDDVFSLIYSHTGTALYVDLVALFVFFSCRLSRNNVIWQIFHLTVLFTFLRFPYHMSHPILHRILSDMNQNLIYIKEISPFYYRFLKWQNTDQTSSEITRANNFFFNCTLFVLPTSVR